mmetsp:Transcript_51918/g.100329  ORF Transcript_51918/g.100329 Transcript_51918/m.100329 type:complete len:204 (-) Transcript_51918:38-649(-)
MSGSFRLSTMLRQWRSQNAPRRKTNTAMRPCLVGCEMRMRKSTCPSFRVLRQTVSVVRGSLCVCAVLRIAGQPLRHLFNTWIDAQAILVRPVPAQVEAGSLLKASSKKALRSCPLCSRHLYVETWMRSVPCCGRALVSLTLTKQGRLHCMLPHLARTPPLRPYFSSTAPTSWLPIKRGSYRCVARSAGFINYSQISRICGAQR